MTGNASPKRNFCKSSMLVAVLVGLAVSMTVPVQAALLDFNGNICAGTCSNNDLIDQSYGDIAGQVDVQYTSLTSADTSLKFWNTGFSDLTNVAWTQPSGGNSVAEIAFLPTGGNPVRLNSFDLGAYPTGASLASTFTILDGLGAPLTLPTPVTIGAVHSTFPIGITSANGIRLQWGPQAYNVGIDNVDYSVVPIPPAMLLFASGSMLVGWYVKRRDRTSLS